MKIGNRTFHIFNTLYKILYRNYISYLIKNHLGITFYLLTILIILHGLGFNFPIPWDDEPSFIFQAIAFAENNSLFTNILSDSKTIMWMQPGYILLHGLIYKLFGYSFELSRMISWVFYIMSIILFYNLIRKSSNYFLSYFALLIFLLPSGLAIGNVARMDVMILFLYLLSIQFLIEKKYILLISMIIIGLLTHFNTIYLLIALSIIFIYDYFENNKIATFLYASKTSYVILFLSIILLVLYLVFIYLNFSDYQSDMAYQFARKLDRIPFYLNYKNILIIISMSIIIIFFFIKKNRVFLILTSTGLSLFILFVNGQEMWYSFFLLISVSLFFVTLINYTKIRSVKIILMILFFSLFIKLELLDFSGMYLRYYPSSYIDLETKQMISEEILKIKNQYKIKNMKIYVNVGNSLFFYNFTKKNGISLIHLLPEKIQKHRDVDIAIYIYRNNYPSWLKNYETQAQYDVAKIVSTQNGKLDIILRKKPYIK